MKKETEEAIAEKCREWKNDVVNAKTFEESCYRMGVLVGALIVDGIFREHEDAE